MPINAIRGNEKIDSELDLKAHLASLMRLENVAVLLGAGASTGAGGMTMKGLWNAFVEKYVGQAHWLAEYDFISLEAVNERKEEREIPNVEELNDSIEIALAEWKRREDDDYGNLKFCHACLKRTVIDAAILNPRWWETPAGSEIDGSKLDSHRELLQKLVAARQPGQASPWVFTTNYDLAIEWAADSIELQVIDGFLGVHARRFSPHSFDLGYRNTQARGEARFGIYNIYLSKLHGSLNWYEEQGHVYAVQSLVANQYIKEFLNDQNKDELALMVMPRAAKYMQTVGYVLGELFRRFSEYLSRPQSCLLVCGYGFGDEHINRMIRSALLNPTLQIVIYAPEFNGDAAGAELNNFLKALISLKNPRVTIVGGGEEAYLDKLVAHLPEPLLYDEEFVKLKKAIYEAEMKDLFHEREGGGE